MAVYVAPISSGLGDLIVSLPVIQAVIDQGHETYLVCRSSRQEGISERVPGLAGEISEEALRVKPLQANDRVINLREHPLQKNFVWGSPQFNAQFGPLKIAQIIEIIASDMNVKVAFGNLQPLRFSRRSDAQGAVLLIAGTDGFQKHWPISYWLALHELVLPHRKVIVVGAPDQSPAVEALIRQNITWLPTPTIGEAIDLISSCAAVVSVDTGLMHLAVHQGRPTVAFFNRSMLYQRLESNCKALLAPPCSTQCQAEFPTDANLHKTSFTYADNQIDQRSCFVEPNESCMGSILPSHVVQALADLGILASAVQELAHGV